MASNDNQAFQISLIIFVMLTIVLAVSTWMLFGRYQEADKKAKAAETARQEAEKNQTLAESDTKDLKTILGYVPDATLEKEIRPGFKADMQTMTGVNLPEDKQSYRDALTFLKQAFDEKNAALSDALDTVAQLNAAVKTAQTERDQGIAAAQAAQTEAESDRDQQRQQFNQDREKFKSDVAAIRGELDSANKRYEDLAAEKKRNEDASQKLYTKTKQLLDRRNEQFREATASDFEIPDGEIRQIINGMVYINLGSAEGIQRQTLFSVYGTDPNSVVNVENKKASIEVTQVMGEHLSEAKILEDDLSNPIVPGDKIESPLFVAGRPQSFALAGVFDLDDDKKEDREQLRNIISMGGGVVAAEVMPDGKVVGALTPQVQFLVLGDTPLTGTEGGSAAGYDAYVKMRDEANLAGVAVIDLDKFLKIVGWTTPTQSIRYGRGGNSTQIRETVPDGGRVSAPGNVSEIFRQRKPPKSKTSSAYSN